MLDVLPDWKTMDPTERLDRVKAMAAAGETASFIAGQFTNATRMSVIGLCARKKLKLMGKPPKPPTPPKAAPKPKKPKVEAVAPLPTVARPSRLPRETVETDDVVPPGALSIMQLKANSCRYIHGDPRSEHGYCGKRVKTDSSYCSEHHARVYLVRT